MSRLKSLVKSILSRLGILPYLRKPPPQAYPEPVPSVGMLFPTFGSAVNYQMAVKYDYFRSATIGLAVQRIMSDGILGSLAEVGVYRGEMSKFIHQLAPSRRFYLFDTFEGFPRQDLESYAPEDNRWNDTSVKVTGQSMNSCTTSQKR
jgi:hypothetical protein